jgi:hypothetical protein
MIEAYRLPPFLIARYGEKSLLEENGPPCITALNNYLELRLCLSLTSKRRRLQSRVTFWYGNMG